MTIVERETAAEELVRVAKRDAPLFVSVIDRLGVLRTILLEFREEMRYCRHNLEVGDYVPGVTGRRFTAAQWFLPEELQELFEKRKVKTLDLAGLESLSSHLKEATKNLYKDKWKMWMDIIIKICNRPWVVGTAEHILYVGRKQTRFLEI